MKIIWVIAKNTYREIIRDRILYGLLVFALLIIGLSLALGQLSFAEQSRISLDFGLTGIQLSSIILSIFVGSTLVTREIEKRTVLTLLARSMSRTQFLIGKYLGLELVIITVVSGLAAVLYVVMLGMGIQLNISYLTALWGVLLESSVLLSVAVLFGSLTNPLITVVCTLGVFLIGHWMESLNFLAKKGDSNFLRQFSVFLNWAFPNFESFNWRTLPVYGDHTNWGEVIWASEYSLAWVILLMIVTALTFRRRDFV